MFSGGESKMELSLLQLTFSLALFAVEFKSSPFISTPSSPFHGIGTRTPLTPSK
jgi:hypothetical protein